jgi:riboflavin synthase
MPEYITARRAATKPKVTHHGDVEKQSRTLNLEEQRTQKHSENLIKNGKSGTSRKKGGELRLGQPPGGEYCTKQAYWAGFPAFAGSSIFS